MRKTRTLVLLVSVLTLGLASFTFAQMMGGHMNQNAMGQNSAPSQDATPKPNTAMTDQQVDSLMTNMSNRTATMLKEMNSMESNNRTMMQMQDLKAMRQVMQKQQTMMQQMHNMLMQQQGMWQNMMSGMNGMMNANGMMNGNGNGMMGSSGMMNNQGMTNATHAQTTPEQDHQQDR